MGETGLGHGDWWNCFTATSGTIGINTERFYPVVHSGRFHVGGTTPQGIQLQTTAGVTLDRIMCRLLGGNRTGMVVRLQKGTTAGGMTDTVLLIEPAGTGVNVSSALSVDVASTDYINYRCHGGTSSGTSMAIAQIGVRVSDAAKFYAGAGSVGPANFATASSTRYIPMFADFGYLTSETEAQIKRRGTSTIEYIYARVAANRATDTSIFVRKNGADNAGSADFVITGNTGFTGFIGQAVSITLNDGDQVNYRLLTGSGSGTLSIDHISCLISTSNDAMQIASGAAGGLSWSSAARYIAPVGEMNNIATLDADRRCVLRTTGRILAGGVRVITIGSLVGKFTLIDESNADTALVIDNINATGWWEFVLSTPITLNDTKLYQWRFDRTSGTGSISISCITLYTDSPPAGVNVTPTAVSVIGATVAPTTVLESLNVTPAAVSVVGVTVDPTVVVSGGALEVTPAAVSVVGATVAPTTVLESLNVTPGAVSVVGATVAPTVVLESVDVTPAAVAVVGSSVAPTVVLGALDVTPAAVAVIGVTVNPTVDLADNPPVIPAAVAVIGGTVAPTVVFGSVDVTPAAAAVIGATVAPTIGLGSLQITPAFVAVGAKTVNPTVVVADPPVGGYGETDYEYWRRRRRQRPARSR